MHLIHADAPPSAGRKGEAQNKNPAPLHSGEGAQGAGLHRDAAVADRTRRGPSVPRVWHDERRLLPGRAAGRQPLSTTWGVPHLLSFQNSDRNRTETEPNRYLPASCSHKTLMLRRATEIRRRDRTKVLFSIRQEYYCILVPKYYCYGKAIYTIVAVTRVFLSAQSLPLFAVVGMPANPALFTFVWIVLRTDGGERRGSAVKVCS